MNRLTLARLGPLAARVAVPGSKSIANRALICAALADGRSIIHNTPDGDDTTAMIDCLRALGYPVAYVDANTGHQPVGGRLVAGDVVAVTIDGGADPAADERSATLSPHGRHVDAVLAGTTSRFVTALAALGDQPITIDGAAPLRRRPFGPLHDALTELGVDVVTPDGHGHLPVTITGPPTAGSVHLRGDVTSQFISALMMIGPRLRDGIVIELTSPLISRPYVELTAGVMASFGIFDVTISDGDTPTISVAHGRYRPCELEVEPDASSASYPLAMAAVAGGDVTVPGLGADSRQGDLAFANLLAEMGCSVDQSTSSTTVRRPIGRQLRGINVDMADISDLVPTLVAVALFATSPTRISGVGFIRHKESDRLGDLASEFAKLGADIEVTDDGLVVNPSPLHGGVIDPHHDHRLAMAAAIVAAAVDDVVIDHPDVVTKSWPGFWQMRQELT